jgi:serine/threonine-protein kinase
MHRSTGQLVALKNLEHQRFSTHKFLRELHFLLSLQHPNIVTCRALEHTSTGRYLVMDYCEGGTLRTLVSEEKRLSFGHSLKLVADVLAGLDHAHSRGIVHCDIKPENILLHLNATGWTARISDFGIARFSQEMTTQDGNTGSPAYMAPERFYGQYSASSDLYAVGILLFELLTGYRPFAGTPAELMAAHLNQPTPLPDSIPAHLQPIITQSLQKLSARRFRSAGEMLAAVRTAQSGLAKNLLKSTAFFTTLVAPPQCRWQSLWQQPVSQPATCLAANSIRSSADSAVSLYWASGNQLQHMKVAESAEQPLTSIQILTHPPGQQSAEPIQQLLMRPQGCFVVRAESVELLPAGAAQILQPVVELTSNSLVTIEPQGHWLAMLSSTNASTAAGRQLQVYAFPERRLSRHSVEISEDCLTIQALDHRYLMLISSNGAASAERISEGQTTIQVFSRRGQVVGSLTLPLRLRQVTSTAVPYRLLATEADSPGTVLLIDLKPYRLRRLWVEMEPQFLVTTSWGYILAAAKGQIMFLDQEERQIGTVTSPEPITAMTLIGQYGLLLATWNASGSLIYLDLRTLGLDLVF